MPGEAAASRELDDEWGKLIRRKSVESENCASERLDDSKDLASAPQRVASGGSQTLPGRRKTAALRTLSTGSQRRAPSTHVSVRFREPDTVQPDPAGLSDDDESTPLPEELEDADMPISRAASSGDSDGWSAPEYDSDGDYAPGAPPAPPAATQYAPRPAPRAPRPAPRAPRLVLAGDWGPDPWLRAQEAVAAGGEGAGAPQGDRRAAAARGARAAHPLLRKRRRNGARRRAGASLVRVSERGRVPWALARGAQGGARTVPACRPPPNSPESGGGRFWAARRE